MPDSHPTAVAESLFTKYNTLIKIIFLCTWKIWKPIWPQMPAESYDIAFWCGMPENNIPLAFKTLWHMFCKD